MALLTAACDKGCGKTFTVTKFRECKVKKGNSKLFFRCPNCKREYISYYTNSAIKKMQKEMRQLQRQVSEAAGLEKKNVADLLMRIQLQKQKIAYAMLQAKEEST